MPVPVRNMQNGPTTFSVPEKNIAIEWQAQNDVNGNDIQVVPDDIVQTAPFQRALRNSIFEILSVDEMDSATEAFAAQTAADRARLVNEHASVIESLDQAPKNDLVQVKCIGPNARGVDGACEQVATIREKDKRDQPPLCSTHQVLATQYIPTESDVIGEDGKPGVTWTRMGLDTNRQRL